MSTTSTTTPGSRSSSPLTPEPSESPEPVTIQGELDLTSSWYLSMQAKSTISPWASEPSVYAPPHKSEEEQMLRLDDLIEQHAYEDSPSSGFNSSLNYSSPPPYPQNHNSPSVPGELNQSESCTSNLLITARHAPISLTKPIPPPASLPRKTDPSTINQRVVYPPKESCFNSMPIMFPSIPEGGTKSRVETQVRVTVDLADSSSASDPYKYDRIGSWKWLKLPQGTATKKRTRKQGKIADPDLQEILHLSATVTCASPPHNRVLSCSSCQSREAKRVAKKLAARVRPARSESELEGDPSKPNKPKHHEDTTSIIQFNCAEVLDFSTGSVVLPLRITCYCRHHREKVGFNVHFSMMDHTGRIVGSGMSRPIMITDDHKTSTAHKPHDLIGNFTALEPPEWTQARGIMNEISSIPEARAPSRRKTELSSNTTILKSRPKPYDASAKPTRVSREGSVSSAPSPSTSYSPLPTTRASTPFSNLQNGVLSEHSTPSILPPLHEGRHGSETSSPDTLATPLDNNSDVYMPEVGLCASDVQINRRPSTNSTLQHPTNLIMSSLPHSMPYLFFDSSQSAQSIQLQPPTIHRLIPNTGPTYGGIEVTVLGANFHPTVQLNCVFGDVAASSTQRWSDNTLVCVLPPRAMPGVVAVWFEGFPKADEQTHTPPSLFTYSDESDRALMELALQVVGLKMTGKIEDAKNVAMRIVGNAGGDSSGSNHNNNTGMMQLGTSPAMRPLLFGQGQENIHDFEKRLLEFLAVIDTPMGSSAPNSISTLEAISYPSSTGQTLLHLAAFMGLSLITRFLVSHGADVDARDCNGFTPLHFAALSRSKSCSIILLEGGADVEVVNSLGKTPHEIAIPGFFDDASSSLYSDSDSDSERSEDEDADLGDAEGDDDVPVRRVVNRRVSRRLSRLSLFQSGRGTPRRSVDVSRAATPPPPPPPPVVDNITEDDKKVEADLDTTDAKRAASFMEKMIQRTLAQIPAQGIIPNMPQLPLPHLPHLPDLPAVPWGALPQLPMVFPVFVPMMPGWPSFFGGEHGAGAAGERIPTEADDGPPNMGAGAVALRAAQEWRATWEKWVALAVATTARQQTEELPPPVYTPRAGEDESVQISAQTQENIEIQEPIPSTSTRLPSDIRPVGYDSTPVPDQVVESFGYQPPTNQTQKKRYIDLTASSSVSMLWAFHNGIRFAFQTIKMALPMRTPFHT
ncbi:hypothetical protein CVT25_014499 [Psilocybe cyanescens]|uniref:IPT/TIG domain-containing protein n=1 Tax=Psilocybe cyanescens TaxID=93625 RepID=A0A409VP80_PSICY|nr:hypothetical protein CVT25_014499 [Psilocybe cyanescens]